MKINDEEKNPIFTHFDSTVSGNRTDAWLNIVTSKRCDICSVGPNSMASVCMFILLVFSFLSMESKCSKSHVSSVRLQLGSWLIKMENSWSWAVCEATVPVAISSKRGNKSVVSSGSGNSLNMRMCGWNELNKLVTFGMQMRWPQKNNGDDSYCMNNLSKLHAVDMSKSLSAIGSRLLYWVFNCCNLVLTTSTL